MTTPRATYRIQLRSDMTFERVRALASYWSALGVSHVYLSPIFAAVAGSGHGYDMIDANSVEPALGGERGFLEMVGVLRTHGLGVIVDFVPNHMAADYQNHWWRDVLKRGDQSTYASHFDIDWSAGPLTLPFLGEPFDVAARNNELSIETVAPGDYALRYHEQLFPLNDAGCKLVEDASRSRAMRADQPPDVDFLFRLHEVQHWRLADWRTGRHHLTYRRFFEITGLVGLRVEDAAVFADVHAKLFELVRNGFVDGVRIDHVDGLSDPTAYLKRLRQSVGPEIHIFVEKILEADEELPSDWPVDGATGYEFLRDVGKLLTDGAKEADLNRAYEAFTGFAGNYETEVVAAKREILHQNLAAELQTLSGLATRALRRQRPDGVDPAADITEAIMLLASRLPVYRTYITENGVRGKDRALLERVARQAVRDLPRLGTLIDRLVQILLLDVRGEARAEALAFTLRFQQTTSAVMAKAVEDTVFYRYSRLAAVNEVGNDPGRLAADATRWHSRMNSRMLLYPAGLNTTATHDTKWGEDARSRLYSISEAPDIWHNHVARWGNMLGGSRLDANTIWLLFQALLGIWPAENVDDTRTLSSLRSRFSGYAVKAVREAKRHTSWVEPNARYESDVCEYVDRIFDDVNKGFREDFSHTIGPIVRAGFVNSLVQLALKLTAPGVPDLYQGTEGWDLSLVDPDNRRPVDFERLAAQQSRMAGMNPGAVMQNWKTALPKQYILAKALTLRAAWPDVFETGSYEPLEASGRNSDHVVAFARRHRERSLVTLAPLCVFGHVDANEGLALDAAFLGDTSIDLGKFGKSSFRNALTGEAVRPGRQRVSALLATMPVALLATPYDK